MKQSVYYSLYRLGGVLKVQDLNVILRNFGQQSRWQDLSQVRLPEHTATLGFNMLTIAALHGFILRNFFCFNYSDSHVSCMYTCFHMTNFIMLLMCHLFVSWFSLFSCTLNHNFSLVQLLSRWSTFFIIFVIFLYWILPWYDFNNKLSPLGLPVLD